jgi:hypothetical protein
MTSDDVTETEHISDADLARHKWLQEKLLEAQKRFNDTVGAWRMWGEELHERYGLAKDGTEGIDPDGTITRADVVS